MHIICKHCTESIAANFLAGHINKHQDLTELEKMNIYQESVLDDMYIKIKYFPKEFNSYIINKIPTFLEYTKAIRPWIRTYHNFCNMVLQYRELEVQDIDVFFTAYLPYRDEHPNCNTAFQLAEIACKNHPEQTQDFYDKVIKIRNPYTGHGKELSPWSKDFVGYKNISDEEKEKLIRARGFNKDREDFDQLHNSCTVKYYLDKGYTEAEAKQMLHDRQSTFSLEKCIQKYGEEKGKEVFNARQEKWLKSLNTEENQQKIKDGQRAGFLKACGFGYSQISQTCFHQILEKLNIDKSLIYFGENNGEYCVTCSPVKHPWLDFYIPSLNKWIEFDGEYWHGEARGNQERDKLREEAIRKVMPNIELKRIRERDYKADPAKVISECVAWINE